MKIISSDDSKPYDSKLKPRWIIEEFEKKIVI